MLKEEIPQHLDIIHMLKEIIQMLKEIIHMLKEADPKH